VAGRVSIAPRLALRDLARYQARSGAALAAVTLALGIAAAVVVTASAERARAEAEPPSLSDGQIRVYLGPSEAREVTPVAALARLRRLAAGVRELAAQLDRATAIPLRKAVQPGVAPTVLGDTRAFPTVELARRFDSPSGRKRYFSDTQLYVATPAVLDYLGLERGAIDPSTDYLVDRRIATDGLVVLDMTRGGTKLALTHVQKLDLGRHLFGSNSGVKPPNFVTLGGLRRHGWKQIPAGWLVESRRPLTGDQIAAARGVAAEAGLTIEVERKDHSLATVMAIATAARGLCSRSPSSR
jgi:putative ABC transport system permease protein